MPKNLNKEQSSEIKSANSDKNNQKTKTAKGLGKGLGALLSGIDSFDFDQDNNLNSILKKDEKSIHHDDKSELDKFVNILCASIISNPNQPRKNFSHESIEELALSIKSQGILQPIVVKWLDTQQKYQIIAGERRWRAAKIAGLDSIPAIVKNLSQREQILISIIENIQRAELTSIEEANAFSRLKEEFNLTHEQIAEQVSKSRSHITNLLRLLNLSLPVQEMLNNKQIDMGHARALLSQDNAQQIVLANMIINKNLSVREIENYIKLNSNFYTQKQDKIKDNTKEKEIYKDKDLENLQNNLEQALGTYVSIKPRTKSGIQSGKGSIIIKYDSLDILDGILSKILSNA